MATVADELYSTWVRELQHVEARYATGDVHDCGQVIGFTDRPTLIIRRADGSKFSWIAAMCEPSDPPATKQGGAPSATAGGAPAPIISPEQVRATAEYLARMIGCTVVDATPLPPFKRRPVLKGSELTMDGDDEGNVWPNGVGWSLSWDCRLTFGRDESTGEPTVVVSMSGEDLRRGITSRMVKRHQVAEFARLLAEQFGEPASSFDAAVEQAVDRVCADQRAEIERLRTRLREIKGESERWCSKAWAIEADKKSVEAERDEARVELTKAQEAFSDLRSISRQHEQAKQNAENEVARLLKLVGNENIPYDGWDDYSRHDAIVRCEEGWQEHLKQRDQIETLTAERDRLRAELDRVADQQPKFRPGQYVRVGLCDGIVITPKDTTRVQFEGMLHTFDIPTRDVHAIDDIAPAEPRRWVAGDPEPEIGTTVRRPDRGEDGPRWTRRRRGWHPDHQCSGRAGECSGILPTWSELPRPLVEVVSADGE